MILPTSDGVSYLSSSSSVVASLSWIINFLSHKQHTISNQCQSRTVQGFKQHNKIFHHLCFRPSTITGLDQWAGLVDQTGGLTLKILHAPQCCMLKCLCMHTCIYATPFLKILTSQSGKDPPLLRLFWLHPCHAMYLLGTYRASFSLVSQPPKLQVYYLVCVNNNKCFCVIVKINSKHREPGNKARFTWQIKFQPLALSLSGDHAQNVWLHCRGKRVCAIGVVQGK